jgi:hypothetical protein
MAKKISPATLAKTLANKVSKEADGLQKSVNKLTAFIALPTGLLGGYKMMQKLKKQARVQQELVNILRDREVMFEKLSETVVETK